MAKKGKLKGKAKAAFLRRMAAGRRKAGKVTKRVKSAVKRRRKSSKTKRKAQRRNITKRKRSTVAKKTRPRKSGRFQIPSVVKKAAAGVGLATIAVTIVQAVAPQAVPLVRPIAAFVGGGIPGIAADLLLSGGAGILGNFFGGGQSVNGGEQSV